MKLKSIWTQIAACSALALAATAAHADLYNFSITGDYTASWQMDSTVTADDPYEGEGFIMWDVAGSFSGAVSPVVDLTFFHGDLGGGIGIDDFYEGVGLLVADGPQLYSGSELTPTFLTGTYALTESGGSGSYTLTISAAVPEPTTYALLLGGLGVVGFVARRRKSEVAAAA